MNIEFIGLPGVGKTTLLERMNTFLEQESISLFSGNDNQRSTCYIRSILFILKFIVLYPSSLKLVFTSFRWLIIKLSFRNCLNLSRKNKDQQVFFSKTNGVLMPIITYTTQRNPGNIVFDVSKVLASLPLPDVLIVVTADIDIVVDRYSNRGGLTLPDRISREKVVINSDLYRSFSRGLSVVNEIVDLLQKKKVKIIQIDNNQDVDNKALKRIIGEINNG
jgi:thymidylate kinase